MTSPCEGLIQNQPKPEIGITHFNRITNHVHANVCGNACYNKDDNTRIKDNKLGQSCGKG